MSRHSVSSSVLNLFSKKRRAAPSQNIVSAQKSPPRNTASTQTVSRRNTASAQTASPRSTASAQTSSPRSTASAQAASPRSSASAQTSSPRTGNAGRIHSGHSRISGFLHLLFPALPAACLALLVCRLVSSPPDFLLSEEQRFVRFTEEVFRNELSGSTLNLHYTVADPSSLGIETDGAVLGSGSLESREAGLAAAENYRTALLSFDYNKLSEERQLTYDVFLDYLDTALSASELLLYEEPLGATLGVQAQLPVLFAEYTFRTKGDIEDYLSLLSQIPDYFDSILSFEQDKAEAGLFMSSGCADAVIEQCMEFAGSAEDLWLAESFDEKIDAITNLTQDEKISYKAQDEAILTGSVLPAYQALAEGISKLSEKSVNEQGLFYFPEGKAYYEYLVKSKVGDSRSIEDIEESIKTQMVADYIAMQKILSSEAGQNLLAAEADETTDGSDSQTSADKTSAGSAKETAAETASYRIAAASSSGNSMSGDPAAILAGLRQQITADFPTAPDVDCEVRYVPESLQEYLSPAFYLTAAVDDYTSNVIYINPASDYSDLELFTTLAHEGYPGHLYQTVWFQSQSPDLLRTLLGAGGYTEGWATYVEMYAYSLWEEDPTLAALQKYNRSFTLGAASLLDIGIHYRGYSEAEVSAFLGQLGFSENASSSLYQTILESPANYLQYYVGYLNFQSLYDSWSEALDNFSAKEFHRAVLEAGPLPFELLERELNKTFQKQ